MNIPKLLPRRQTSVLRSIENEDDADDPGGNTEPNTDVDKTDSQQDSQGENKASNQAILRLLGDGEKVFIKLFLNFFFFAGGGEESCL